MHVSIGFMFIAGFCGTCIGGLTAAEPLVVHEWGTFTVLQDALGREIRGVNVDDEPVPSFVHQLHRNIQRIRDLGVNDTTPYTYAEAVRPADPLALLNQFLMKSVPMALPAVTMRMETPVIYFYPADTQKFTVDVEVKFNGGWLSEWYPQVSSLSAPGFLEAHLRPTQQSFLKWDRVQVNSTGPLVATDSALWLAPRQVQAAHISMPRLPLAEDQQLESEKYIFYRGWLR